MSPLASAILNQLSSSIFQQQYTLKQEALSIKRKNLSNSFSSFYSTFSTSLQLSLKLTGEKGASSLLSTLPMVLLFTRVTFVMQSHFIMVGHPRISLQTVFVADLTVLNMPKWSFLYHSPQ